MCGLVGVAGDLSYDDEKLFKRLLLLDYWRGTDSTGMCRVPLTGEPDIHKIASHPIDFFDSSKFKTMLQGYSSKAFIGHNRAATIGKVNAINAHPFEFGSIYGAHNGTLDKKSWNRLTELTGEETDVDSAAIFQAIDTFGVEDTIKELEEGRTSREGAWALTFYDSKTDELKFIRNRHRPLWFAITADKKKIIWASEWPMIDAALHFSSNEVELLTDDDGACYFPFEVDTLYSFELSALKLGKADVDGRIKEIKGREPAPVQQSSVAPFQGGRPKNPTVITQPSHTNTNTTAGGTNKGYDDLDDELPWENRYDDIILHGTELDPYAGVITAADFDLCTSQGCTFCGKSIVYGDKGVTISMDFDMCLCDDCSDHGDDFLLYEGPNVFQQYVNTATAHALA